MLIVLRIENCDAKHCPILLLNIPAEHCLTWMLLYIFGSLRHAVIFDNPRGCQSTNVLIFITAYFFLTRSHNVQLPNTTYTTLTRRRRRMRKSKREELEEEEEEEEVE